MKKTIICAIPFFALLFLSGCETGGAWFAPDEDFPLKDIDLPQTSSRRIGWGKTSSSGNTRSAATSGPRSGRPPAATRSTSPRR
jgi:hypothetical protein